MEMATQLLGVTMQEAGVSRMVAVDVDQAVEMAARNVAIIRVELVFICEFIKFNLYIIKYVYKNNA